MRSIMYANAALACVLACDGDPAQQEDECSQGTFSIEMTATATNFAHPDGTPVTATFGGIEPQTATTTVQRGGFSVSFEQPDERCNLGGSRTEPVALYVDTNGDGQCTLADDDVFVWTVFGGPSGPRSSIALSPDAAPCATPFSLASGGFDVNNARDALRRLCPEVGDCLPFCRPPDPPMVSLPDRYGGFCGRDPAPPDAGIQ